MRKRAAAAGLPLKNQPDGGLRVKKTLTRSLKRYHFLSANQRGKNRFLTVHSLRLKPYI